MSLCVDLLPSFFLSSQTDERAHFKLLYSRLSHGHRNSPLHRTCGPHLEVYNSHLSLQYALYAHIVAHPSFTSPDLFVSIFLFLLMLVY
jgi:hypothetical protein